ncbi:DUF4391 domain-containing protein [Bifidobacterium sp. ESL0690]|uniref:DUF4391 domain-containing protein n=1 Tax=Bifidobacterium sp. ESL0690 TaxID=2983214 RepID=UPI0023FA1D02|nr:DUF4391 domain-containing protein [Bifidobacterium sp. ESL0690]WEV46362.1 DUF4391 domain-containing protein [Bifidobacterium sp. ESL0690]
MTVAHCTTVSATSLGLPGSCAIPEAKSVIPKQMFYMKPPVSARLKQRFVGDVESITMLALLRPNTINVATGKKTREILVMGIAQNCKDAPVEVMEHIAKLRSSSNILFVCVRDASLGKSEGKDGGNAQNGGAQGGSTQSGSSDLQCALALQRILPVRAGHQGEAQTQTYVSKWQDPKTASLSVTGETLDDVWRNLCAQVIFGDSDGTDLDARLAKQSAIAELTAQISKLEGDHARAKDGTKRNEIYVKLHKAKKQLEVLQG